MIFSRQRILLMIGDDGIVVVPHKIAREKSFFAAIEDRNSVREIMDFITRYPKARITLFADNLAQDYRSDDLPRLNIFDRAKLAARRLKQIFPAARLTASLSFKHSRSRALMIGLHESNAIFAWAERLRARLPDIALLPVEGARIANKLMPDAGDWAMLIARQKSGGFRQIVTYRKDLIFTRLTPLPATGSGDVADIIAGDIKASLDYLTRQGLRNPQELSVLLVMQGDLHYAAAFEKLSLESVRALTPAAAAKKLGLALALDEEENNSDRIFVAHFLRSFRPALSLMLPDMKQIKTQRTIRKWGMRAACAALLLVCLSALRQAENLADTLYQTQKTVVALYEARADLTRMQEKAAPVTEPLGRMREALARRHIYEQQMPMPWAGFDELAGTLNADAKLVRLDWKKTDDAAPDIIVVSLALPPADPAQDRAAIVGTFARVAQNIAGGMKDYQVTETKPPFPDLPQQSLSQAADGVNKQPTGEITLQRKMP